MLKKWKVLSSLIVLLLLLAACGENVVDENQAGTGQVNNDVENNQTQPESDPEPENQDGANNDVVENDPVIEPEVHQVWLYFSDDQLMDIFKVQTEIESNDEEMLPQLALDIWSQGPEQEGLASLLSSNVAITVDRVEGDTVYVNFSENIMEETNLGSTGELFLLEQITMIMEQFGYAKTFFLVGGQEVETLLGHMSLFEPVEAGDPEEYETY